MRLAVSLLGPFQVTLDGGALENFGYDKVRALLAYLCVESNQPLPREQVSALLWPEQSAAAASHSLSQALLKLRRALREPSSTPHFIKAQRGVLEFRMRADDYLDTRALGAELDACESHAHLSVEQCEACAARLERAVGLYRGDFLEGVLIGDSATFEEWVILRREQLRRRVLYALEQLTRYHVARGKYDDAEMFARRQLELEPYLEEAHRSLMQILARNGKRSAGLAQYEHCRRVLAQELGIEPSAETTALFEQLRAAGETRPHNLPLPLPALIGRAQELAQIAEMLANPECHLLNLVGPGGIGKTTLALTAAQSHLAVFLDGVFFVPLAALTEPAQLPATIANALSLDLRGESDVKTHLLEHLRAKTLLLVLDNFEHLLEQGDFLSELVRAAPHIKLLLTSREPLNLRVEWLLRVEGLGIPPPHATLDARRQAQAFRLFMERARRASAMFAPTDQEEFEIARICRTLWGSPLGIELAAGWTGTWSCAAIANEIEANLDFLATEARDVPARHHSLRAVLEHSWTHLNDDERARLRRLAIFRLPFSRRAAQAVTDATVYQLGALVSKSLLTLDAAERYALHPLLKQFLTEKLATRAVEQRELCARHVAYFAEWLAAWVERRAEMGEERAHAELRAQNEELRAALLWSAEQRAAGVMERMGVELYNFSSVAGQYDQGAQLFADSARALLAHAPLTREEERVLAKQYGFGGALAMLQGANPRAQENLEQSLTLARAVEDSKQIGFCVHALARIAFASGDVRRARALLTQSLELRLQLGDAIAANHSRYMLGNIALGAGRLADADAFFSEGLSWARAAGYAEGIELVIPLNGLGVVAYRRGDRTLARQQLEESLRLSRALGHLWSNADCLTDLARVAADQGEYARAEELIQESLSFYETIGKRADAAHALRARGWLAECQGQFGDAQHWYAESHARMEQARQTMSAPLALVDLGRILARRGEPQNARALLQRARAFFTEIEYAHGIVIAQTGLGIAARVEGDLHAAQNFFENALGHAHEEIYEGIKTSFELASVLVALQEEAQAFKFFSEIIAHPATPHHHYAQALTARTQLVDNSTNQNYFISRQRIDSA